MIDPTVRSATQGDADQIEFLEQEARTALADARGGSRWLETHPAVGADWVDDLNDLDEQSADRAVFVAHIDLVVVGYIVLTIDLPVARIADVYVTPAARELGFGDALLEQSIERARHAGASMLEGDALPGDRDTKNMYERAGIKARLLTVSTSL